MTRFTENDWELELLDFSVRAGINSFDKCFCHPQAINMYLNCFKKPFTKKKEKTDETEDLFQHDSALKCHKFNIGRLLMASTITTDRQTSLFERK